MDESMLTGESLPVEKSVGDVVVGSTLNKSGSLLVQISKVGKDTVLAQIIHMVESAQGSKAPIQAIADRVVAVFVPVIMALALLTFILWWWLGPSPALSYAIVNAVAVLLIACPCAMGLATPISIMVASGRAAELGVLFRKGEALQRLRETQVVAFDKTGTLTKGEPSLSEVMLSPKALEEGVGEDEVLRLAGGLEQHSEHPIAKAILKALTVKGLEEAPVTNFEAIAGYGVTAEHQGQKLYLGADRYMKKLSLDITPFNTQQQRLSEAGKTPTLFGYR
ncbi:MAG: HAD-IC family P-type ATPase [Deinococcales bacterium]